MEKRFLIILTAMAILSPLGLLAEGTAWGEWSSGDLKDMLGFVPRGLGASAEWWQALFPDYAISFLGDGALGQILGYMLSALTGALVVYGLNMLLVVFLKKKRIGATNE